MANEKKKKMCWFWGFLFFFLLFIRADCSVSVSYFAPFLSPSGYGNEAWAFALGLAKIPSLELRLVHHGDTVDGAFVASLPPSHSNLAPLFSRKPMQGEIVVCHSTPDAWNAPYPKWRIAPTQQCPPADAKFKIGRTMYETDSLPNGWKQRLDLMDEVWVPTDFHKFVFQRAGVDATKLVVIGESVDSDFFDPSRHVALTAEEIKAHTVFETRPSDPSLKKCRFVSNGKWEERKGFEALIRSFREAFSGDEAELIILSRPFHDESSWASRVGLSTEKSLPRVAILENLASDLLARFYRIAADGGAFVLPSRGEGWGRPYVEAMAMETVVIATNFSGQTAYMKDGENALLARVSLEDRGDGHKWAIVDERHLIVLLKSVCDAKNRERMQAIARRARADMISKYSIDELAGTISKRLEHISKNVLEKDEL